VERKTEECCPNKGQVGNKKISCYRGPGEKNGIHVKMLRGSEKREMGSLQKKNSSGLERKKTYSLDEDQLYETRTGKTSYREERA